MQSFSFSCKTKDLKAVLSMANLYWTTLDSFQKGAVSWGYFMAVIGLVEVGEELFGVKLHMPEGFIL